MRDIISATLPADDQGRDNESSNLVPIQTRNRGRMEGGSHREILMNDLANKPAIKHKDCPSCEYREGCFSLLKFLHNYHLRICLQGRKSPVRTKAKDQAVLPIPEDTEGELST